DARTIGELRTLRYKVPGLERDPPGPDVNGRPVPTRFIVTTPNMTYIPDFSLDSRVVQLRQDGRYYTGDFTQWPQWYHPSTAYLPFVRARPSREELRTHEFALAWYNLRREDFEYEEGSAFRDFGRIKQELGERVLTMRRDLGVKVEDYAERNPDNCTMLEIRDLRHCARGMKFASLALTVASQTYNDTLLTFTSFQRYYLETRAIWEFFKLHRPLSISISLEKQEERGPMADLVGAVTCDMEVAQDLYNLSVPVWLVRPPSRIPRDMIIDLPDCLLEARPELNDHLWPGSIPVYDGPASAVRNRASQTLRAANIEMGHSASRFFQFSVHVRY
ncbi:hypothetical protein GALMADRAFT_62021, partial [Galerina marginata CBS 339.88]